MKNIGTTDHNLRPPIIPTGAKSRSKWSPENLEPTIALRGRRRERGKEKGFISRGSVDLWSGFRTINLIYKRIFHLLVNFLKVYLTNFKLENIIPQNPKPGKCIDFVVAINIYETAWRLLGLSKSSSILKAE